MTAIITAENLSEKFTIERSPIKIHWDSPYIMANLHTKFYTISLANQTSPLCVKFMSELHQGKIKPPHERKTFPPSLQIFKNNKNGESPLFQALSLVKQYFENEIKQRVNNGEMKQPVKIFTPFQYGNAEGEFQNPLMRLKINCGKTEFGKLVQGKPEKMSVTEGNIHEHITSLSKHDGFVKLSVCEHSSGITLRAELTVDFISKTAERSYPSNDLFTQVYEPAQALPNAKSPWLL